MRTALLALALTCCSPAVHQEPSSPSPVATPKWRPVQPVDETVEGPSDRFCHEQYGRDEMAIQEQIDAYKLTPKDIEHQRAVITKRREDCARRYGEHEQ